MRGSGNADVRIVERNIDIIKEDNECREKEKLMSFDGRNYIFGDFYGKLKYLIIKGEKIAIDPSPECSEKLIQSLIQGVFIAMLLRQRGYFVLHASGVAKGKSVIGFVGDAGWGKSTLASHFASNGYTFIVDDTLAIDTNAEQLRVIPGFPLARVRHESRRSLMSNSKKNNKKKQAKKHIVYPGVEDGREFNLAALFLLEPVFAENNAIVPISNKQAMLELIGHTRVSNLIGSKQFQKKYLEKCRQVIMSTSLYRLKRKEGVDQLPQIFRMVDGLLEDEVNV